MCACEMSFTFFAGMPANIEPDGTCVPSSSIAPAATMLLLSTTQLSITIAPIPIRTLSCIVHPCTIALCPMLTLFPIVVAAF